jgi:hypothetical protein
MPNRHSSRRVPPLKESEIDHEINLVDNTPALAETPEELDTDVTNTPAEAPLVTSDSQAPLKDGAAPVGNTGSGTDGHTSSSNQQQPPTPGVQPPTPRPEAGPSDMGTANGQPGVENGMQRKPSRECKTRHPRMKEPATAIDVLYENERGGFLCGIPLFSGAALGNLDPAPWTNAAYRTSPTNTRTAQVPDPSWVWAWPSWRVNRDDAIETDRDGWEYSFMFSRRFSWHGPHWYNSFVRRRAWIRRRIQQGAGYLDNNGVDAQMLNPDYFAVTPRRSRSVSRSRCSRSPSTAPPSGHRGDKEEGKGEGGGGVVGGGDAPEDWQGDDDEGPLSDVETIDELMARLRRSRIDRERLDAAFNYLEHDSDDLLRLQDHMHEIMSLFVFQASRRLLLTRLMEIHEEYESRRPPSQKTSGTGEKEQGEEKLWDSGEKQSPTSIPGGDKKQRTSSSSSRQGASKPVTTSQVKGVKVQNDKAHDGDKKGKQDSRPGTQAGGGSSCQNTSNTDEGRTSAGGRGGSARHANLETAIQHADEEVRRLEYWSDVRSMAINGETDGATAPDKGWGPEWEGLDRSGG